MNDLTQDFLPTLLSKKLPGIQGFDNFVFPSYEGFSIGNLPHSISHMIGAPDFGDSALDESIQKQLGGPYKHVILLLIDGFGLEQLEEIALHPGFPTPAGPGLFILADPHAGNGADEPARRRHGHRRDELESLGGAPDPA